MLNQDCFKAFCIEHSDQKAFADEADTILKSLLKLLIDVNKGENAIKRRKRPNATALSRLAELKGCVNNIVKIVGCMKGVKVPVVQCVRGLEEVRR